MEVFEGNAQYNDWTGTVAVDHSDAQSLSDWLRDQGHVNDDEQVVGAQIWVGDNHNNQIGSMRITAYVDEGHGKKPFRLREIEVEMPIEQFIAHFKRFSLTISNPDIGLEGSAFDTV
ncbi:hypothetical protein KDX15_30205 [Burkholderia cenocepacia]|uniref:hypothetical protein n=1 Tax=Burkholderia cepacia complex TaxID=87882 RepID=UPI001B8E3AA5|nr:hypothetical protein [Burkholderia cenocepacia]MBR8278124.1 hypothetical protein [Burkholderia cenocepacia]